MCAYLMKSQGRSSDLQGTKATTLTQFLDYLAGCIAAYRESDEHGRVLDTSCAECKEYGVARDPGSSSSALAPPLHGDPRGSAEEVYEEWPCEDADLDILIALLPVALEQANEIGRTFQTSGTAV